MLNSREFYPDNVQPKAVLILPNHLASTFETDFSERAEELANHLGMLVLAYERPKPSKTFNLGVSADLEPNRYIQLAAQTGRELENRLDSSIGIGSLQRIITGNSAAGTDAVLVAYSQEVKLNCLIVDDVVGTSQMSRHDFKYNWKRHQTIENELKASKASGSNDENVGKIDKAIIILSNASSFVPVLRDLASYIDAWRSTIILEALQTIATSESFYDLSVLAGFVEHSFANTPEGARTITNRLNGHRPETAAPFKAEFQANTYHSHNNDPKDFAKFINLSLIKLGLTQDKAA
jgi:hypothetical protein